MPYWISGDLLIRSHNSSPKDAEAYDWVSKRWSPIPDAVIRRISRRDWRPLTRVDVEAIVAEP